MRKKLWDVQHKLFAKLPYVKIFMYITLVCTLVLMIFSFLLYSVFSRMMFQEYGQRSSILLEKAAESTGFLLEWSLSYALQASQDPIILSYAQLNHENNFVNFEVWTRLKTLRDNHPYIESLYLVNGYNGTVIDTSVGARTKDEFYDKFVLELLDMERSFMSQKIIPRELEAQVGNQQLHHRYLSIVIPYELGGSPSIFVMNINSDELNKAFGVPIQDSDHQLDLMMEDYTVISSNQPSNFLTSMATSSVVQNMSTNQQWFIENENGIEQMIVYADVPFFFVHEWSIIMKFPLSDLNLQLVQLRNNIILVFALIFICGVVIIWLISRRIYSPIGKLVKEVLGNDSKTRGPTEDQPEPIDDLSRISQLFNQQSNQILQLSQYRENHWKHLKESFLKKLLVAGSNYSHEKLIQLFMYYKVYLPSDGLQLVILRLDGFQDFNEKYDAFDQSLLRYSISNIVTECMEGINTECVDMGHDHVVMICGSVPSRELLIDRLTVSQSKIAKHLQFSVTVAVSLTITDYAHLSHTYRNMLELSNERFKLGTGKLIEESTLEPQQSHIHHYPDKIEKQLLMFVRQRKEQEAYEELRAFMNSVLDFPYSECRLAVTHLIVNLGKTLNTMQQDSLLGPYEWGLTAIQDLLEHMESVDAIHQWLVESLSLIFASSQISAPTTDYKDMVNEIFAIVEQHLFDPNLSSKLISDQVGLSVNYIRTMFKSTTGTSIIDYISSRRIDYASDLLLTSSKSVEEIAIETGFVAISSFYAAFKKKYGITPAQFRKDAGIA